MKRSLVFVAITFLLGAGLAACDGAPPTGDVTCAASEFEKPTNLSPADGGIVTAGEISFTWDDPTEGCIPTGYRIQLLDRQEYVDRARSGDDVDEAASEDLPPVPGWSDAFPGQPGQTLHWRVRALGPMGAGPWSELTYFAYGEPCVAGDFTLPPTIYSPREAVYADDAPILFEWAEHQCLADGYHLQVSNQEDFSSLEIDRRLDGFLDRWTLDVELENCRQYFWRVASLGPGSLEGEFSEPACFVINRGDECTDACRPSQLVMPVLEAPVDGAHVGEGPTLVASDRLLQWSYPLPCLPGDYVVELATSNAFGGSAQTAVTDPPTSSEMDWGPVKPLLPFTQYWWRVAARIPGQGTGRADIITGPFSAAYTFITGADCEPGAELPPELLSPADGSVVDDLTPSYAWAPGAGGCLYPQYCVRVSGLEDWEVGFCVNGLSAEQPAELIACEEYSWYVTGEMDEPSMRSDVQTFIARPSPLACLGDALFGQALQDLACRRGPGTERSIVGYVLAGETSRVYGQDMAQRWLAIDNLDNPGERCWVPMESMQLPEGHDPLRVLNEPVECKSGLDETACAAAGGTWVQPKSALGGPLPPYCQCP